MVVAIIITVPGNTDQLTFPRCQVVGLSEGKSHPSRENLHLLPNSARDMEDAEERLGSEGR